MDDNGKQASLRTSRGLRDALFDALDAINNGTKTAQEVQAICKVCAQITNSVNMEIEFYKHIGRHHADGDIPDTSLNLGSSGGGARIAHN